MSEATAEATTTEGQEGQQPETETVESLQAKLAKTQEHSRTWEKRAKENAAAAKRLAELEDSQKSESEKAADRIAKAEAEAASVPAKVADGLRSHLVALHEIDAEDAELFLTASDPELLLKQVERLIGQSDKRKRQGNVVPREGSNPKVTDDDPRREFLRGLMGR